jgi:hypothetical protein
METSKNKKDIFTIGKDPEKQKFIETHTYDNISLFSPGKNTLFDSIIKNNQNNLYNFNIENEGLNQNKDKQNIGETSEEKIKDKNNMMKLKVILNYAYQKDYFEFCLPVKIFYNAETHLYQFSLNDILDIIHDYINNKTIFLNENYGISYYTNDENKTGNNIINLDEENENNIKQYFFIGNYPLNKNIIYFINIPSDGILYLKFRKKISKEKSLRYDIFEEENEEEIEENERQNNEKAELNYNVNSKRANEKKIGYIIKKVFYWKGLRKYTDNKMSLIEAAANVGLSKKTLDEYYNQIKEGKRYNFDFNKHKKDKVNILRGYVKKMNEKNQDNKKNVENKEKTKKKKNK